MAKLQGPLFSISASGSLAALLCYRATPHGPVVQRPPIPRAAASFAQRSERDRCAAYAALWRAMSPDDRAPWLTLAVARRSSPWIAFHNEATVQQVIPPSRPLLPVK